MIVTATRPSASRVAAVLTAALICALSGAPDAQAGAGRCRGPAGASVVVASTASVVYLRRGRGTSGGETDYYGCLRSSGQRVLLLHGDLDSGPARMRRPRVAGRFVAFVADTSYHGVHDLSVEAFDLGRGRRVRQARIAGSLLEKPDGRLLAEVRQIALNVRGMIAWRASGLLDDRSAVADTVGDADARGARVLEAAPLGSLGDLRLTTTAVMWRAGGMPRSTLLGDQ